ncbi:protein-glutamate methylesterase/protein-glutamine glutaminase [Dendrosporobacter sp. 1207_IL3150]|uniref:protein-glutamate methylesterase/protein-glutamine glutaminase n=1 Tax=Dendrosporobacter sp. 1207_IL3150 TaxID=3084054 RepID=UPI002FD92CCF
MIRILIVDDSAFMRKMLTDVFTGQDGFLVIDTARNGKDAIDKVKRLKPDLVTMDVEMPIMDGMQALEVIMQDFPTPVVMVSSLTQAGADATIRALALGAVDFVAKAAGPISSVAAISEELIVKCRSAVRANVTRLALPISKTVVSPVPLKTSVKTVPIFSNERVIAIGTSTGGPRALQEIITKLPGNLPCGVVIVQHMPPGFTKSLADRLNSISSLTIKEAENNDVIRPGLVLIAPGDYHMTVETDGNKRLIKLNQSPPLAGHRPAVDPLFESVAKTYGSNATGVILTGMGHDGAKGMQAIKQQHGFTIAEDQSTAVVFGMPKSAIELGVIDKIAPINNIASEIVKSVTK